MADRPDVSGNAAIIEGLRVTAEKVWKGRWPLRGAALFLLRTFGRQARHAAHLPGRDVGGYQYQTARMIPVIELQRI